MMARKKRRPKPPFLRPGAVAPKRPSLTKQLGSYLRKYPALRAAYTEIRRRFENTDGVCGIGVGRKFNESTGQYGASPESTGGLCIKVFVERKKKQVPMRERIPSWIDVSVKGSRKKTRVLLDVVSVAGKSRKRPVAVLQNGRGWPEAGKITPGRLFSFGKKRASEIGDRSFAKKEVSLGTTGAVVRFEDGSQYGISAGHVFTDACSTDARRPEGGRALGVKGREWEEVQGTKFHPVTIKTEEWIRDLMLFPLPPSFRPSPEEVTWPDGFLRELATQADIERAVKAETATGFIWIDRKGLRPESIPVDLEAGAPLLTLPVNCHGATKYLTYVMCWPLRFVSNQSTIGGDSGSPVFLWTEDNSKCRLLGMHFLELQGHAYAMDAGAFFREVLLAKPNENVWFV
jgi:hypothetical protein